MTKPHFIFTQYKNSFSVHIQNLEELSVEQIRNIQSFVENRKGIFNFDTYSFSIQKRFEFNDFLFLLQHTGIEANCEERHIYKKADAKIDFGKYKGMRYNELPDVYLVWLKSNYRGKDREIIDTELKRRNL